MAPSRQSRIWVVLLLVPWAFGCETPGTIPWRAEDGSATATPSAASSRVWVSYQIAIESVDGLDAPETTRPSEPCVYYSVALPAGQHKLRLRLDYRSAIHQVRSADPVEMTVRLGAGKEYRLLDLSAGQQRDRTFTPWLQEGAPPAGVVTRPEATK